MRRRLPIAQLAIFLVIAVACTWYVGGSVLGGRLFSQPFTITMHLPDSAGLAPLSQVTYRGVEVGQVRSVRLDPSGTGVTAELEIQPQYQIPANTAASVDMDTPIAVQHVDFKPTDDKPPYLTQGSVISSDRTSRPLPLETLLVHLMELADSINPKDLQTVADQLSIGLRGLEPELRKILDNTGALAATLRRSLPQIVDLIDNGRKVLGGGPAGSLPELTSSLHQLTSQLREQDPAVRTLLDQGPDLARQILPLLQENQHAITVLLGNLVSTSQILSARIPALKQTFISLPKALAALTGIADGDAARMSILLAQGPVCYYPDSQRRPPTETAPKQPITDYHCDTDRPNLQQRGAQNVPRPAQQQVAVSTYDPATGKTVDPKGQQIQLGPNGGQHQVLGQYSWYSMFLQGAR